MLRRKQRLLIVIPAIVFALFTQRFTGKPSAFRDLFLASPYAFQIPIDNGSNDLRANREKSSSSSRPWHRGC
jgi:hypothetical protein